jgi:hypothetical protein
MEPITLIVTALVTGAALGLHATANQAVQDAYAGLKRLILDRYGTQAEIAGAVESVEAKPDSKGRKLTLTEELEATQAAEDAEVLAQARALLQQADPEGAQAGHYEVTARDHSVAVGGSVGRDVINIHGDGNVMGDHNESQVEKG